MQNRDWARRVVNVLPLVLLAVVTAALFAPSLGYPLMIGWDDPQHVTENTRLAFTWANAGYWWHHAIIGIYMPVTMLTYMVDHAIWGLNPLGYRLQSLGWHLVAVLAFWGCCRRLGVRTGPATLVALLFAIHPQRVESVAWISERKDVLCAALYFLSLYLYLGRTENGRFPWTAWLIFVLALLSKPMAVSLPFVILGVEFYRRRNGDWRYYLRQIWPWLLAAVAIMAITANLQVVEYHHMLSWSRIVLAVVHNIFWYVDMTLFPRELGPIYPRLTMTPLVVMQLVGFYLLAAGAAYWTWRQGRARLYFCVLPVTAAFLTALAPVAAMIHASYIDYADRYSYIPSAFLWFALAWLWQLGWQSGAARLRKFRAVLAVVIIGYGVYLAGYTGYYLKTWANLYDMLQITCMREQPNDIALCELAWQEQNRGNVQEVVALADRLEHNIRPWMTSEDILGQKVYANYFRANVLFSQGYHQEAEKLFLEILRTSDYSSFYRGDYYLIIMADLYLIRMEKHDVAGAIKCLDKLLDGYKLHGDPNQFKYHFYLGMKALLEHRESEAERSFARALELEPDDTACRENLRQVRKRLAEKPPRTPALPAGRP